MHLIKQIVAVFLSLLVLGFSSGITISKHFCKNELVDLAINSSVKKCKGAKKYSLPAPGVSFSEKSCCTDEVARFQTADFSINFPQLVINQDLVLVAHTALPIKIGQNKRVLLVPRAHAPPLQNRRIHIIHEQFLI